MKNIAILAMLVGCKPVTQDSKAGSTLDVQKTEEATEKKVTETITPVASSESTTEKKDVVHAIEKVKNDIGKEEKVVVPELKK